MKKLVCAALALLLVFSGSAAAASGDEAREAIAATKAKGAVLMEASSGRVLYEVNSGEELPVASTTKIMTAILTLEQPDLDESFVVDPDAIRVEGSSMGLREGDVVTLRTLAWGMLLASGNDAANAAAVRIDGDVDAFCARMNQKAQELGMRNTNFESPSGLDVGEHHSTAYDMALLARYALQNETFAEMVRSKSARLYYGNPPYHRWLTNHNRLLWQCEDCIGIKTGFTKQAGRCLVTAAERDGLLLIAVTLGCPDDFDVHHEFYDICFGSLSFCDLTGLLGGLSVPVTGGLEKRVGVKPAGTVGAYLSDEEKGVCHLAVETPPFLYAPIREGEVVGQVTLTLGDTVLATSPLLAKGDYPARFPDRRSFLERVRDFFADPLHEQYYPIHEPEPKPESRAPSP